MLVGPFGIVKLFKICWFLMIINMLNYAFWQKLLQLIIFQNKNLQYFIQQAKNLLIQFLKSY